MTSTMLTGGRLATAIKARVSSVTAEWNREGIRVTLAVVVATADESTLWYVRSIASAAAKASIECRLVDLGADATELEIAKHLTELSDDSDVHGIILQTPLPAGVTAARLVGHIDPQKDIDGANPVSLGRLAVGEPAFAPATAPRCHRAARLPPDPDLRQPCRRRGPVRRGRQAAASSAAAA